MTYHQALRNLEATEKKAWNAKMKGSDVDTCTIFGQVGKLEQAWRDAADACRTYREQHGLLGLNWKQIERVAA
jgi:hypothetical protein